MDKNFRYYQGRVPACGVFCGGCPMYNSKVDADAMRYTIAQIEKITEKRSYYPLLLDADPSKEMIEKYLKKGKMFTFAEESRVVGEVVVLPLSATDIELKNIAVLPEKQGQGLGRYMIEFVARHYADQFRNLYVGTADSGIALYQKFGFEVSHRVKNFFTDNYPEPIVDSGIQCIDMIYLLRKL